MKFGNREIQLDPLYASNFSSMDDFWAEGAPDVKTENHSLFIRTTLTRDERLHFISTVFCRKRFTGHLLVEFDARSIHTESHRNFNIFLHTTLPDGRDLYETRTERTGDYPDYHKLNNYLFTFLPGKVASEGEASPEFSRWRFRRNPGFRLIKEVYSEPIEQQRWYHFQYLVQDGLIACSLDQNPLETYGWLDPSPLKEGHIGFRTYCSHMEYRDLKVWTVKNKPS